MALTNKISGNFTIDGIAVTDPQVPYKFQLNTTGIFYRNMNATRSGTVVANLKKVFWKWNQLTLPEATQILSIIYNKLESGSDEFTIKTDILGKGSNTDLYYLGQPLEFEMETPLTCKMEIHWIQVNGKKSV